MGVGKELSYLDIRPLLVRLADLDRSLVLVGGQAVGFWSWVYRSRRVELQKTPITSKDLDFCGDRKAVRVCAQRLMGEAQFPSLDNVVTPNSGVVFFSDADGVQHRIDILGRLYGIDSSTNVQKTSLPVDLID